MKYRTHEKTGVRVSEIGIGAWQLGGPLTLDGIADGHPELGREFCIDLIRQCGERGINFIDTAEQYGNGESERRVGEALKGHRADWVISTKFGHQVGPNGERVRNASPSRVPVSLEGSLRRLQTDYVDIYIYHIAPKPGEAEQVAQFLDAAKRKGQVRAVGISTPDVSQVEYLHSLGCLDFVQFPHNLLYPAEAITAFLAKHQVAGVVRGAFAGGRLSGRYFHSAPQFRADDFRSTRTDEKAAEEFLRCAVFEELLTPERGMVQLALRYLLDEPTTLAIIPGGKNLADYEAAIRATEIAPLAPTERARLIELRNAVLAGNIP
jgi:aryl-alcohol dehydrogenase-like predicted oxidoreductase